MMRLVIFSDAHFHNFKNYAKDTEFEGRTLNSRFVNQLEALQQIYNYCLKQKIKQICFCGDLFHVRGHIDVTVFNEVYKQFRKIIRSGINITMIPGNHDASGKFSDYSIEAFKEFGVEILVNDVKELTEEWSLKGVGFHKTMLDDVKDYPTDNKNYVLLAHLIAEGSQGVNGYEFDSEISLKDLSFYRLCFLGHIHKRQELSESIIVPGSFVAHDWGDANNKNGFYDVVLNKGGEFKTTFNELNALKFRKTLITKKEDLIELQQDKKSINKLVVKDKSIDLEEYKNCIVEYDIKKDYVRRLEATEDEKPDYISQYVNIKAKEHKHLNKDKLNKIGNELLNLAIL